MLKKIILFSFLVASIFLKASPVSAIDRPHYVSFTNPIRGIDGQFPEGQTPLDLPKYQYQLSKENGYPVDWLLRYDALVSATISGYFKTLSATDSSQVVGGFMEVTPALTLAAGIPYPEGDYLLVSNRAFLSGYSQADRKLLIDTYMKKFFDIYGYYPGVVGAWHIDAYSLEYLRNRYSVLIAVICDEQYNTDSYRLWGGYLGSPYYPSRYNFLVPAKNRSDRIDIVLTKWAQRDPSNFYGTRIESNFSTQVNDYTFFGLNTQFFKNLIGIYSQGDFNELTQTNIGLENDYDLKSYKAEMRRSFEALREIQGKNDLRFVSSLEFSRVMHSLYSYTNPAYFFRARDFTGKLKGETYWYQNPYYRIGLRSVEGKSMIIDLRIYNSDDAEGYYQTKNIGKTLYAEIHPTIDSIKYPGTEKVLDIDLEKANITYDKWRVTFESNGKKIELEPDRLVFTRLGEIDISDLQLVVKTSGESTILKIKPKLPFTTNRKSVLIGALILLCLFLLFLSRSKNSKLLFVVGVIIGIVPMLTMIRSGLVYPYGMGIWGPNGHDALFHLSLSESFKYSLFSLNNPQLDGHILRNYHFGFDYLTSVFSLITQISTIDLYFRLLPVVLIFSIIYFEIKLLSVWRYRPIEIILALIFSLLGGSAGFIANIILGRPIFGGESMFWANQSVSILLNPPFALSILGLLVFFLILERRPHRMTQKELIVVALIGGLLSQAKIYAFLLLIAALILKKRFKLSVIVSLTGLIFLLPSLSGGGFPFELNPLWFPRSMFESHDRLYFFKLAQAWQVYENNGVFAKLLLVNLLAVIIFFIGNLWTRVIGLTRILFTRELFLTSSLAKSIVLIGLVVPLVFTQKVNPWNTIQFMYYSLFFLGIFTAKQIGETILDIKNNISKSLVVIFIVIFSLPTTVGTIKDYLTAQSSSRVSMTELHALEKLKNEEHGVVVSPLTFQGYLPPLPNPRPLYAYTSTAYVSALSGKPEYLSDLINLDITGFDYDDRQKNVIRLYQTRDPHWVRSFIEENKIKYIYETPFDRLMIHPEQACLKKIFDSGEINLYKYTCQ